MHVRYDHKPGCFLKDQAFPDHSYIHIFTFLSDYCTFGHGHELKK